MDATATELPVSPPRFETFLASEEAVPGELLAAHHDEFVMLSSILKAAASSL